MTTATTISPPTTTISDGPTHSVTFPLKWLAAIRLFAAKKDARYYLNGVAISRGGLVATNGHYLGVLRDARFDDLPELILPDIVVDTFLKVTKSYRAVLDVTLRWHRRHPDEPAQGTLMMGDVTQSFLSEVGQYPDWPRILIPRPRRPDTALQFNWKYLALFEKAAAVLTNGNSAVTYARFQPCGDTQCARITVPAVPEFEGTLMGLRYEAIPYEDEPELQDAAAAA